MIERKVVSGPSYQQFSDHPGRFSSAYVVDANKHNTTYLAKYVSTSTQQISFSRPVCSFEVYSMGHADLAL